jgi:hypothetical protein
MSERGQSPVLGLPYPEPGDLVRDHPTDHQQLVDKLDTYLKPLLTDWQPWLQGDSGANCAGYTVKGWWAVAVRVVTFAAHFTFGSGASGLAEPLRVALPVALDPAAALGLATCWLFASDIGSEFSGIGRFVPGYVQPMFPAYGYGGATASPEDARIMRLQNSGAMTGSSVPTLGAGKFPLNNGSQLIVAGHYVTP